jgi:hypothetical protein
MQACVRAATQPRPTSSHPAAPATGPLDAPRAAIQSAPLPAAATKLYPSTTSHAYGFTAQVGAAAAAHQLPICTALCPRTRSLVVALPSSTSRRPGGSWEGAGRGMAQLTR